MVRCAGIVVFVCVAACGGRDANLSKDGAGDDDASCADDGTACTGKECGTTTNNCGATVMCGSDCSLPKTCGGGGTANMCAISPSCTNLCLAQVSCPGTDVTTSVSGVVRAPNGVDPIPGALIYVPNATVQAFAAGVACDQCSATASGSPLVSTHTATDGSFKLANMPVGSLVPLVVQIGRWRRQIIVPTVTSCVNTPISVTLTRLPKNKSEGDIPHIAVVTGAVDAMECVLRKIGIEDSEFTSPNGTGRIHLYVGNDAAASGGAHVGVAATEATLVGTQATLNQYDMLLFACQGAAGTQTTTNLGHLHAYADAGGRVFATHFNYNWLATNGDFATVAGWNPMRPDPANQTAIVNTGTTAGTTMAQWLLAQGASSTQGQIPLVGLSRDMDSIASPAKAWLTITTPVTAVDLTFDTPIGNAAAQQCGRVEFAEYHVETVANANGTTFPAECVAGAMTPQEKLLEYRLFDLDTCVGP